ncbi:beta keto-acyl synthase [Saccharothrix australiensis]|uniref:PfaB family protein n=1 Tax=Saccharothrix australiensis TaxID=2072 RepID=A0A495W190_9PSEU|nr:beta keto-acyl synthase [Saccharothrix australiensis]RKT54503.1 PfaB family protein [Saccharothrix australiensis]
MAGREPVAVVAVAVAATGGGTTRDLWRALFDGVAWSDAAARPGRTGHGAGVPPVSAALAEAARDTRLPARGTVVAGAVDPAGAPPGAVLPVPPGSTALAAAADAVAGGAAEAAVVVEVPPTAPEVAVVLVLKRTADARRDGDVVSALLDVAVDRDGTSNGSSAPRAPADLVVGVGRRGNRRFDPVACTGVPAADLFAVACAVLAVRHRALPRPGVPARAWPGDWSAEVATAAGPVGLRTADAVPWVAGAPVALRVYSGADRAGVVAAVEAGRPSDTGPARLVVWSTDGLPPREVEQAALRWLAGRGPKPAGAAYRDGPVRGEVALVFGNGAAAYPGMGAELLTAFPRLVTAVEGAFGFVGPLLGPAADAGDDPLPAALRQIWGAGALAGLHRAVTGEVLGLRPDAVIGYSSGEMVAMAVLGVWRQPGRVVRQVRESWLYTAGVVGGFEALREAWRRAGVPGRDWACHLVHASPERVREVLAGERAAHLMLVNAPESCVVGGERDACARVVGRLGADRAQEIDYPVVAHVPELAWVRDRFHALYHQPTTDVGGTRFYSCATTGWYVPTPENVAEALTAQLVGTADFARTVERAWQDGVRVFVEHGPRGVCSRWIGQVLEGREHLAVALDAPGPGGVRHLVGAVAELLAAGVRVDVAALLDHLSPGAGRPPADTASAVRDAYHVRVARVHQEFVEREGAVHRRFLDLRARLDAVLRGVGGTVTSDGGTATPPPGRVVADATADGAPVADLPPHPHFRPADLLPTAEPSRAADPPPAVGPARVADPQPVADPARAADPLPVTGPPPVADRSSAIGPPPAADPAPVADRPSVTGAPPAGPSRPPLLDRARLEQHADRGGELFGPLFAAQRGFRRQTRLPKPPVLLVDRVVGLDAEPASMTGGTIRTETDLRAGDWHIDPTGRVAPALLPELGQGNILLLSWLGVDLTTGGERVYRALGAELTYHGSPPAVGDTVEFETAVESFTEHDGLLVAAFRADCRVAGRPRLTVRAARAGFFTEAELAGGGGVVWRPEAERPPSGPLDPPARRAARSAFGRAEVRALAEGRPADCFGPEWRAARSHLRTPRIAGGELLVLDEVTRLDFGGGPWRRGYLRAETALTGDEWFFACHFAGDPCMPGSLMLQGCAQAAAFYLAATGCTVERDGWRFEPVPDRPVRLTCRTQATPRNRHVAYEVFVRELSLRDRPTLVADVLCSVDGVGALHGRGLALRLVPDWPLEQWRTGRAVPRRVAPAGPPAALGGLRGHRDDRPAAEVDGFRFDYPALLACAWGRPSDAFGPSAAALDGADRVAPRCPGPPYHFMSRIAEVTGPADGTRPGGVVEAEYDVPERAWFFDADDDDDAVMPFAVVLEAALQPCGWLAAHVGGFDPVRRFRNLDGSATLRALVRPGAGVLRTRAELTALSTSGGTTIERFEVTCRLGGAPVLTLSTVFGFFPDDAFADRTGLPVSAAERAAIAEPAAWWRDLRARDGSAGPPLSVGLLRALDRITGYWPTGGSAGLGRVRGEKRVDPGEWYFRAHFFQDPVQPGSLGLEAMLQLVRWYAVERGLTAGPARPRFEPVALGRPLDWTYRGQVLPTDEVVTVEADVLEVGRDERGPLVVARTRLWVDGRCVHEATPAVRVVGG